MLDDHNMYKENFGFRGIVRDEWNQNIIFLVNGVRQRSGYDFNNKLVFINVPIQSIERIEVIKGASSVSYGSGAFFGVINIITTNKKSPSSDIFFGTGTQNTFTAGANIRTQVEDLSLTINTGYSSSDGIDQNYRDMGLDTSLMSGKFMHENNIYASITAQKGDVYSS